MNAIRLVEVSVKSLKSHFFRSILASLGVVLGVASVVAMIAISEGARKESLKQIKSLGIDNIIISSIEAKNKAATSGEENRQKAYGVNKQDIDHIATFENIESVVPIRDLITKLRHRGKIQDIQVFATNVDFLDISYSHLIGKKSRFFTDLDMQNYHRICVVGSEAARILFDYRDPIGEYLSIAGFSYKIVGVIHNDFGYQLGDKMSVNKQVLIPFSTAGETYGKSIVDMSTWTFHEVYAHKLNIRVKDVDSLENTAVRIKNYLRKTHSLEDYRITVPLELVKQKEKTQKIFTIVMASIAAISLIVGGIGIMNIMLANIYERTREIGTRRALGATQSDIVLQFLCESTLISGVGGAFGVGLGFLLAFLVEHYGGMLSIVSPMSVAVSFSVSVLTGVLFGTYPAWQASKLDPAIALRRD